MYASGIVAYASYVPSARLSGEELSSALGSGSPKGSRPVASYDEDSTTMGVEAARRVVQMGEDSPGIQDRKSTRLNSSH